MFGWFRPTCPCDPAAKAWVEERLQWLTRQFGLHILLERPVILPNDKFFSDPYDGSSKAVRRMFGRVCGYMAVDPDSAEIKLFTDPTPGSVAAFDPSAGFAAGTWQGGDGPWQKGIIRIELAVQPGSAAGGALRPKNRLHPVGRTVAASEISRPYRIAAQVNQEREAREARWLLTGFD